MYFFFNLKEQHSKFLSHNLTGALYVHPLWFYKHQHDNRVRSKLSIACQRWWFQWRFWFVPSVPQIHTHPVSWNCAYRLRMELSDGGCFPNLVRNCRWTIAPRQSFWITLYYHKFNSLKWVAMWPAICKWTEAGIRHQNRRQVIFKLRKVKMSLYYPNGKRENARI